MRVVSKSAVNGKLYNCIVPVTTVLNHYSFEVYSDALKKPISSLREKDVETALPRSKDVEAGTGNR